MSIFSPPLLFTSFRGSLSLCHLTQLIFKEQQKIKIHKTATALPYLKSEENYLCYSGIVLAFSSFCLNTIFDSPTLISNPKRNLDQVCRYATYYVGRRYMRKHARILHTLLWLMHQLSQSRKRCCISTFFITISTKITTMKVPFHQYTITAR